MAIIELVIKDGDKVVKKQDIEIKDLNFQDRLEYNDLMVEHYNNPTEGIFKRVGNILRLCTSLKDEHLNKFSDPELLQIFNSIAEEYSKKK